VFSAHSTVKTGVNFWFSFCDFTSCKPGITNLFEAERYFLVFRMRRATSLIHTSEMKMLLNLSFHYFSINN